MGTPNARSHIHRSDTFGQRAADAIARGMGSWAFIIVQSLIVGGWIALNLIGIRAHWDPYPFILLNLLFSTQAAYAAPIIMMSQNRQAQKDHLRDDHEAAEVDILFQINRQQLEILHLLRRQIAPDAAIETAPEEARIQERIEALQAEADALEEDLGTHEG